MQLVFSDAQYWEDFLPLTFTKPISELRCGILTFAERWEKLLDIREKRYITEEYLEVKYPRYEKKESLLIVPNFLPTEKKCGLHRFRRSRLSSFPFFICLVSEALEADQCLD